MDALAEDADRPERDELVDEEAAGRQRCDRGQREEEPRQADDRDQDGPKDSDPPDRGRHPEEHRGSREGDGVAVEVGIDRAKARDGRVQVGPDVDHLEADRENESGDCQEHW